MTTALQIIDRAYSLLGFKAAGEALNADDATYALEALNTLLDGWNTQSLFIVSVGEVVATISGVSATVGPGMAFDTARPVTVEAGAFSRIGGIDYPVRWIDREAYARIALKTVQSSFPQFAYYDASMPTGNVFFYPQPASALEFHLPVQTQLTAFQSLSIDYPLAPGYTKALQYSLAEELAPGIKELPLSVARTAANARRAIRRTNVSVAQLDSGIQNARFNIYSGR